MEIAHLPYQFPLFSLLSFVFVGLQRLHSLAGLAPDHGLGELGLLYLHSRGGVACEGDTLLVAEARSTGAQVDTQDLRPPLGTSSVTSVHLPLVKVT